MMDISQQPDFARMASSLRVAADEAARCRNLEPVQQHAGIVAMFNALREDIQAMEQRLIQRQDTMEQRLYMRIAASEANTIARVANQNVMNPDDTITPLRAPDNTEIPHFPARLSNLLALTGQRVDAILGSLEQSTDGDLDDRRQRLRKYCGMRGQLLP